MPRLGDSVSIIEACYEVDEPSDQTWFDRVSGAVLQAASGPGIVSWLYDHPPGKRIAPKQFSFIGETKGANELMLRGLLATMPGDLVSTFASIPCMLGREAAFPGSPLVWRGLEAAGIAEVLVLNARDPSGNGAYLGVWLEKRQRLGDRSRQTWAKVAAHVVAGQRLRRRLRGEAIASEAVVSPNGTIVHAESPARSREALDALKHAAKGIEKAKGKLRRQDQDAAVDEWRGLIAARWSLVEHFESDGKRYFLAKRNDVPLATVRSLPARELQAVAFASLGHSNKLIAYEMGISASTVGVLISRAAKRIGAKSRSGLIDAFKNAQRAG